MPRSAWIAIAVVVVLALIFLFRHEVLWALNGLFGLIGGAFSFLWWLISTFFGGIWKLLVAAVQLAWSILEFIVAGIVVLTASLLGIGAVVYLFLLLVRRIVEHLNDIATQVKALKANVGQSGKEATFLALVAILSALVAYMATDDFLGHLTTIRFVAMCCIGLVAAKIIMMFASRLTLYGGIVLTVVIIGGALGFIVERYKLARDFWAGLDTMTAVLLNPSNRSRLLLFAIILVLSVIALLYPFTIAGWKRVLSATTEDDEPKAAGGPPVVHA
jgi:hypothetical protein